MNWKLLVTLLVILALGGAGAYFLAGRDGPAGHDHAHHGHEHHDDHAGEARGPHRGRLLKDGLFTAELAIVSAGTPPEFRAWFTHGGQRLAPAGVKLVLEIKRPDGTGETFTFAPEADYLRASGEVAEPHSFDYVVTAEYAGRTHRWTFSGAEMQARLRPEAAQRAGLVVESAGPATIADTLVVYGHVKLNADRIARAAPRFGGIAREARKSLGDAVTAGETVAVVEANQSLTTQEVKAPAGGVIVERAVAAGEAVADGQALYTIADLSEVWIDLHIPQRERARVKAGQSLVLHGGDGGADVAGRIARLSPFGTGDAQTFTARVVVSNADGRWRPGLFVRATLTVSETTVPVAVKETALQTLGEFTVVFSQHGEIYQGRPLELGRRGGGLVEVRKGLRAGERYVTENSFLLKAEIGKAGATHDH